MAVPRCSLEIVSVHLWARITSVQVQGHITLIQNPGSKIVLHKNMYRKIRHNRWHILEVVGGLAVGLLFVYVSICVGRNDNFIDSYVPILIGIVGFILSSYPISWAIIFMLVGIACGQGNCL